MYDCFGDLFWGSSGRLSLGYSPLGVDEWGFTLPADVPAGPVTYTVGCSDSWGVMKKVSDSPTMSPSPDPSASLRRRGGGERG